MKSLLQRWVLLAAVLPAANCPAPVFMKLGDIKGEATAAGHSGWIEVDSLSEVIRRGATTNQPISSLVLTKQVDTSSPKLLEYCANGTPLPEARIELLTDGSSSVRLLDIRLENVLVINYTNTARAGDDVPTESISFNFDKITWRYTTRNPVSQLPQQLLSSSVNLDTGDASGSTNSASFAMSGIRTARGDAELQWQGQAGRIYDIYSVSTLTGAFSLSGQRTATVDGPMSHIEPTKPGAMFFVVEERP